MNPGKSGKLSLCSYFLNCRVGSFSCFFFFDKPPSFTFDYCKRTIPKQQPYKQTHTFRLFCLYYIQLDYPPYSHPIIRVGTIPQSSSETSLKLFRFTVGLRHLEKLSFAQASAHIASANAKKSEWQIFKRSAHRAKNQNFRNPTNYIPLDREIYANHYSQKDYTLKSNCKKDISHNVSLYLKTLEQK